MLRPHKIIEFGRGELAISKREVLQLAEKDTDHESASIGHTERGSMGHVM